MTVSWFLFLFLNLSTFNNKFQNTHQVLQVALQSFLEYSRKKMLLNTFQKVAARHVNVEAVCHLGCILIFLTLNNYYFTNIFLFKKFASILLETTSSYYTVVDLIQWASLVKEYNTRNFSNRTTIIFFHGAGAGR